ncbi:putative transposase, partial [Mesorhizobium qingshengii]
ELPIAKQAAELGISRGSVYSLPKPTSAADLKWKPPGSMT